MARCAAASSCPQGYVYVGVPPLYKLEVGRRSQYCYTEEELKAATAELAQGSYHVQRFKASCGCCCGCVAASSSGC
jgi:DNA gyrase/topoisomerase IV subunit B